MTETIDSKQQQKNNKIQQYYNTKQQQNTTILQHQTITKNKAKSKQRKP